MVFALPLKEELQPETMLEELNLLIDTLQNAWAYADWNKERVGLDLNDVRQRYVKKLNNPLPYAAYYDILARLIALLHDGHAGVAPPAVPPSDSQQAKTATTFPADLAIFGRDVYIIQVLNKTCWDPAPEPGDKLIRCGNDLLAELLPRFLATASGSTQRHRRARLAQQLPLLLGSQIMNGDDTLTVEKADGSHIVTRVRLIPHPDPQPQPISVEWIKPAVAHMKIASFAPEHWFAAPTNPAPLPGVDPRMAECIELIDTAFRQVESAESLILDLRGNAGGTDILGKHVAHHLLPAGFAYYRLVTRYSEFLQRAQLRLMKEWAKAGLKPPGASADMMATYRNMDVDNADLNEMGLPTRGWSEAIADVPTPGKPMQPFTGQLILLTDSLCFSAADNLIACLQDEHPNVITVGEATGGGTGAPRGFTLPHTRTSVYFCTMKVYRPAGGLIEGVGSEPDVAITPTPDDLRLGRDAAMAAAIQLC